MSEEKKSVPKQSKKSVAVKKEVTKPTAKKTITQKSESNVSKTSDIIVGSKVSTPSGKLCQVLSIEEDLCYLERLDNKRTMYLNKNKLEIKK